MTTTTTDVEVEGTPLADPAEQAKRESAAAARLARLEAAKAEQAAAKEAARQGLPIPETPAYDALNQEIATMTRTTSSKSRTSATKAPSVDRTPPPKRAGFTPVALRSDKHVTVIESAVKGQGVESDVKGLWFDVKNSEAQRLVDMIGAWATAHRTAIYDARLAVATLVQLRHDHPKVTDSKPGVTSRVVDGLNAARASGKVEDWAVTIKLDGTLAFHVTYKGGKTVSDTTARALTGEFMAERPAPAKPADKAATVVDTSKQTPRQAARLATVQPDKVAKARQTRKAPATAKAS